jgi:hypothetical protein
MSKEAMKLALEAFQRLDLWLKVRYQVGLVGFELDAIKALEEALAKQEQGEPVAWMSEDECTVYTSKQVDGCFQHDHIPLYTTPQQRTWVGLTDDEIMDSYNEPRSDAEMLAFGRELEAKLKEKNT